MPSIKDQLLAYHLRVDQTLFVQNVIEQVHAPVYLNTSEILMKAVDQNVSWIQIVNRILLVSELNV